MKYVLFAITLVIGGSRISHLQAGCFPCSKPESCSCAPAPKAYCCPTPKKVKVTKDVYEVECKQICVPGIRCCFSNLFGGKGCCSKDNCTPECVTPCDQPICGTCPGEAPPCGKVKVIKILKKKTIDVGEEWVWEWKVEGNCTELPGCCKPEVCVPEDCAPGCCAPVEYVPTTSANPSIPQVPAATLPNLPQPTL